MFEVIIYKMSNFYSSVYFLFNGVVNKLKGIRIQLPGEYGCGMDMSLSFANRILTTNSANIFLFIFVNFER